MGINSCGQLLIDQGNFFNTGLLNWDTTAKTANFTAVDGNGYFVNTTSAAVTVTLPAGSAGDFIGVSDYASTSSTNNITISPNGTDKINGINDDYVMDVNGIAVSLLYVDSTRGWKAVASNSKNISGASFITATGGTITTDGDYKIHTFTGPGTFTVTCLGQPTNTVEYLVVAGGGGGAGGTGGGGGAGGFRTATGFSVTAGVSNTVTVGAGGAAGVYIQSTKTGGDGGNSVFSTITSNGGGGGASNQGTGGNGGSGGGAGHDAAGGSGNTPSTIPSQGNNGGSGGSANLYGGGGGGGASASGTQGQTTSDTSRGKGGNGTSSSISGSSITYAGGGGGGIYATNSAVSPGGSGGGGNGGNSSLSGQSGTTNRGGGGGGAGNNTNNSGAGGSGIVVIRYKFQ